MSQTEAPQSYSLHFSLPGKVFLLGEYAVLAGVPAVVAAVGPRFRIHAGFGASERVGTQSLGAGRAGTQFAEASPAGRLLKLARDCGFPEISLRFEDPYQGHGGFGASTAQFGLLYQLYSQVGDWERRWDKVWKLYRELTATSVRVALPPSGADLAAQWRGGVTLFDPAGFASDVWPLLPMSAWSNVLVFSATALPGRKVATHDHLSALAQEGFPSSRPDLISRLGQVARDAITAIQKGELHGLAASMRAYADILWENGLESPLAHEDRRFLDALPGVLATKGAGALLSDAVVVVMEAEGGGELPVSARKSEVIAAAESRGLRLVSDGIYPEMGIRSERESP